MLPTVGYGGRDDACNAEVDARGYELVANILGGHGLGWSRVGRTLFVASGGARVVTSESGKSRFLQVPAGQYLVIVRRIGFAPTSGVIDVSADDTLRLSYTLSQSVATLDTMTVTANRLSWRMLEFEHRRRQGQGQFLTRDEIDRKHRYQLSDYLRDFRSVMVSRTNTMAFAGTQLYSRREAGSPLGQGMSCPVQILLDGIILPRNFDLDLLPPPRDTAGVELYSGPSTVPPQLTGNNSCGVMVVWTRDGY